MKKILTSSIAALAFACTLTGCGNNSGKTSVSENPSATNAPSVTVTEQAPSATEKQEVATKYQFTASYDELLSFGFVYDFLFNFQSDNHAQIYIYNNAGKENESCQTINATWKEKTVDGVACLELNDKINPDGKYTIYATNGTYTIEDYYFTFAGSYSRKVNVPGSATIQYATVDAWKDAAKERVSKLTNDAQAKLSFYKDKSGNLNAYSGRVVRDFTWDVSEGTVTLAGVNGDASFACTKKEDGKYTVEYTITSTRKLSFEDLDLSALLAA